MVQRRKSATSEGKTALSECQAGKTLKGGSVSSGLINTNRQQPKTHPTNLKTGCK